MERGEGDVDDRQLVVLAQKGQAEAFEALMERYKRKAYRTAFDFTRDREEAKDLSQDAFLRAFANLKRFDMRASFQTWFYRILVNVCLDHRRRKARVYWQPLEDSSGREDVRAEIADPHPRPDQKAQEAELLRRVGAALDSLPAKQRAAFLLKNHQGFTIAEIAEVMQMAPGTVKVHIHRAVTSLRQCLGELI